jgi:hypothetical protein
VSLRNWQVSSGPARKKPASHLNFGFKAASRRSRAATLKPRPQLERRNLGRSSGFDIHRQILDPLIADHFCFADLFQPRGSCFQNRVGINRNGVPLLFIAKAR